MKQDGMVKVILFPLLAAFLIMGCAAKTQEVAQPTEPQKPAWVDKGSGAFEGEMGNVIYGVGLGFGSKNPAMLRTMADNRARAEVARVFKTYVASLTKDYAASTTAGDFSATSEEQHVEQTIKSFTKAELTGVQIVDHWTDPANGGQYALARWDLNVFQDYLAQAEELSEQVRQKVIKNAEKAFQELASEEARH